MLSYIIPYTTPSTGTSCYHSLGPCLTDSQMVAGVLLLGLLRLTLPSSTRWAAATARQPGKHQQPPLAPMTHTSAGTNALTNSARLQALPTSPSSLRRRAATPKMLLQCCIASPRLWPSQSPGTSTSNCHS